MKLFGRIIKEPLLHFLLMGVGLFALYQAVNPGGDSVDARNIVVTRDQLLQYIQYQSKAFDQARFEKIIDAMPEDKLQRYIDDYAREEALYREAKALNLDRNDYVARRRLIQQLEFITRGFVTAGTEISEAELEAYYEANKAGYYQPAEITFTHVFFNADRRGRDEAHRLAVDSLATLNADKVPFHEAVGHGDRFLYHVNYVNKQADEIASHFGEAMQAKVFDLTPDDSRWHGPFTSPYGEHLVMVSNLKPGYQPKLADIRSRVMQDALRGRQEAEVEKAIQAIVQTYKVEVGEGLLNPISEASSADTTTDNAQAGL